MLFVYGENEDNLRARKELENNVQQEDEQWSIASLLSPCQMWDVLPTVLLMVSSFVFRMYVTNDVDLSVRQIMKESKVIVVKV